MELHNPKITLCYAAEIFTRQNFKTLDKDLCLLYYIYLGICIVIPILLLMKFLCGSFVKLEDTFSWEQQESGEGGVGFE